MEVLSVTSEVFPLVKTGGLADVAGALPAALAHHGIEMRTLVPGYPVVLNGIKGGKVLAKFGDLFGGPARLMGLKVNQLDLIIIDAPHLFDREGGPYGDKTGMDWPDNWKRFGALSFVGGEIARGLIKGYKPQIVHAHDWQAGLTPAYMRNGKPCAAKSVFTIHNLGFQGRFEAEIFEHLKLPKQAFAIEGVEYFGGVGLLKSGLQYADWITTVSPTYAREIRTPEFGMGLEGLLNVRGERLSGILNGIDTQIWNPETDKALVRNYKVGSIKRRKQNKQAIVERFGLAKSAGPLFGVVSRLTWQKGIDILEECIEHLVQLGGQLCVLGSGESELEAGMQAAALRYPGQVALIKGYDEDLSHLMQGSVDVMLVPSRFEPCGLTQLIGLRYGAVPVVARTGGLADTVIDANAAALETGVATGVQFAPDNGGALREALERTVRLFGQSKLWAGMQRRGMKSDVSWDHSAAEYTALYRRLVK